VSMGRASRTLQAVVAPSWLYQRVGEARLDVRLEARLRHSITSSEQRRTRKQMRMREIEPPIPVGRRVVVTGLAGAGKSTFSRALSAKTGLPPIYLDLHFWKPGWVAPPDDEWREKQRGLLAGAAWIADGN